MADDRDARLAWLDSRSPAAVRLAELASFAARIDTGLLRRLRQQLLPDTDVSAESDLWFSPIVESRSETGFQIAPELLGVLRERLLMPDRPQVRAVRQVVEHAHANASPAIRIEETVNGIALEEGPAGQAAIEQTLRPVLNALSRGEADAIDVARWIVPAVPRLHPLVRETPTARTAFLSAALLLRGRAQLGSGPTDPATRISSLGWALSGSAGSQRIGVAFVQGGLQFRQAAARSAFIDAPMTDPTIVELEWKSNQGTRRRLAQATEGALVPLDGDPDEVTVTTLLGDRYRVYAAPGTGPVRDRHVEFPAAALLEACHQIQRLGHDEPIGVVFAVGETLWLGASTAIAQTPILAVYGDAQQLEVVGAETEARVQDAPHSVVALRPVDGASPSRRNRLPLEVPIEDRALRAAAAGFVNGEPAWYDVALEPASTDTHLTRHGVLFQPPGVSADDLAAGFTGSPIVAGGRAVGMIVRITPPQPNESYALIDFLDGPHLLAAQRSAVAQAPRPGQPSVFISYAGEDVEVANRIRELLQTAGFSVWFDRSALRGGEERSDEIRNAIDNTDFFIPVISKSSNKPEAYFHREWRYAEDRLRRFRRDAVYLVPVVIDNSTPDSVQVPPSFTQVQWASAPAGELPAGFVDAMRSEYRRRVGTPDKPAPQANATAVRPGDEVQGFMDILLNPDLRSVIEQLLHGSGPRVLVVDGPAMSAVNEVPRFVQRAIRRATDLVIKMQLIQLQDGLSARELAESIAAGDGIDVSTMPHDMEQRARTIQMLSRWVSSALARNDATRVFLFSGFEYVFTSNVLDFVYDLILTVGSSNGRLNCILLNYGRELPKEIESMGTRFTLPPVDQRAIREFFSAVLKSTGRPYDDRVTDEVTQEVLRRVGPQPSDYSDLRRALEQAADALIRPSA